MGGLSVNPTQTGTFYVGYNEAPNQSGTYTMSYVALGALEFFPVTDWTPPAEPSVEVVIADPPANAWLLITAAYYANYCSLSPPTVNGGATTHITGTELTDTPSAGETVGQQVYGYYTGSNPGATATVHMPLAPGWEEIGWDFSTMTAQAPYIEVQLDVHPVTGTGPNSIRSSRTYEAVPNQDDLAVSYTASISGALFFIAATDCFGSAASDGPIPVTEDTETLATYSYAGTIIGQFTGTVEGGTSYNMGWSNSANGDCNALISIVELA
jgi:hypothetical protein